jgi:hypothetical protein
MHVEKSMLQTELPGHEAAILARLMLAPQKPALSQAAAKGILTLEFSQVDKDRMHLLATKARAGGLTPDEEREVEAYSRVSSLLGILKSKARRALRYRQTNGKAW